MSYEQTVTELRQFLQEMVERMVERPEKVAIVMGELRGCVTYDVRVASADVGRVIGRNGVTARSIRTIFGSAAALKGLRYELNLPQGRGPESVQ